MSGRVVERIKIGEKASKFEAALRDAANSNELGAKDSKALIRRARRQDVYWKTEVPVTDPHASKRGERRRRR